MTPLRTCHSRESIRSAVRGGGGRGDNDGVGVRIGDDAAAAAARDGDDVDGDGARGGSARDDRRVGDVGRPQHCCCRCCRCCCDGVHSAAEKRRGCDSIMVNRRLLVV